MFKTSLDTIFGIYEDIHKLTHGNGLIEVSVKKSRINFEFEDGNLLHSNAIIGLLEDPLITEDYLYMTSLNDDIRITCDVDETVAHNMVPTQSIFSPYFELLEELGEHICQCPALEFVVSENFLKIFIDKPSISLNDLEKIKEIFDEDFTIEVHKQRPYCLFVKTNPKQIETDNSEITNETNDFSDFTMTTIPGPLTSSMVRKI